MTTRLTCIQREALEIAVFPDGEDIEVWYFEPHADEIADEWNQNLAQALWGDHPRALEWLQQEEESFATDCGVRMTVAPSTDVEIRLYAADCAAIVNTALLLPNELGQAQYVLRAWQTMNPPAILEAYHVAVLDFYEEWVDLGIMDPASPTLQAVAGLALNLPAGVLSALQSTGCIDYMGEVEPTPAPTPEPTSTPEPMDPFERALDEEWVTWVKSELFCGTYNGSLEGNPEVEHVGLLMTTFELNPGVTLVDRAGDLPLSLIDTSAGASEIAQFWFTEVPDGSQEGKIETPDDVIVPSKFTPRHPQYDFVVALTNMRDAIAQAKLVLAVHGFAPELGDEAHFVGLTTLPPCRPLSELQ